MKKIHCILIFKFSARGMENSKIFFYDTVTKNFSKRRIITSFILILEKEKGKTHMVSTA